MKKLVALILAAVLGCLVLTSCGAKDPAKEIIGTWEHETNGAVYVFNEDGTGKYNGVEFTYTIKDNKLSVLQKGNKNPFKNDFLIDGGKLIIKGESGTDVVYIKAD